MFGRPRIQLRTECAVIVFRAVCIVSFEPPDAMHRIHTGSCNYVDGSRYSGQGKAGQPSGAGEQLFANGDTYVGEWKEGMMDGQV